MHSAERSEMFGLFSLYQYEPDHAVVVAAELASRLIEGEPSAPGLVRTRVHLSLDRATVVVHELWEGREQRQAAGLPAPVEPPSGPVPDRVTVLQGVAVPGIEGPAANRLPGLTCVVRRQVADSAGVRAAAGVLARTGGWKREHPGFVGAAPFLADDGRSLLNYVQWLDEAAYHSYMSDPRVRLGQEEVTRLEVAPASLTMCRMLADRSVQPTSRSVRGWV